MIDLDINLIFDRGALGALPLNLREKYYQKMLSEIGPNTIWLISVFDYNQKDMSGPPFSIKQEEIAKQLSSKFKIELLEKTSTNNFNIKNISEKIYLLKN